MTSWHADILVGDWLISPKLCNISRDGLRIGIKHKSMAVLLCLADANGEVLSRNDIMDAVWPGMEVTDDVLTQSIVELRKAFKDEARHPTVIETIPKIGFRLIADVKAIEPASTSTKPVASAFSRRTVTVVIALLAVGASVWVLNDRQESQRNPVITVAERPSIAVLPFVNMSDDDANEYFADGLTEEILTLLSRVPGLKVIGRTSSFAFKGKDEDLRVIGEILGVNTVLEGSVRKSGDHVRITAQLIDVADGSNMWSRTYDRTMTDIFAVQDDVAAAIIDALQVHVSENPTRDRPTESSEAYSLYLRARILLDAQRGEEAIPLLRQATTIDSNFAEAFELLAFGYWQQAGSSIDMSDAQVLCNEAAARTLALNPDLTFAQAMYLITTRDRAPDGSGIDLLERAWREQPNNSGPLRMLIYELTYRGYLREAHRFAVQFVELDPLSPVANYSLGESLVALGRMSEAFPPLELSLELDNDFARWFLPAAYLLDGRDEEAIESYVAYFERFGMIDTSWVGELITNGRDPNNGEAYLVGRLSQISRSVPEEDVRFWRSNVVLWYLIFGFYDSFYEAIFADGPDDRIWSYADSDVWLGTILGRSDFTSHPRYLEAAEALGMFGIWEQRRPPDFCEKVDGQWVCN